ncbi:hypothetical protein BDQ17DRAFT_1435373 [Cyathus striatus]|nr:hypothetical protein BDQ17DRAFT_1435373 [Cyathus striatus]
MTSLIRVDDRDPSIVYSENGWARGGDSGTEYNGTTTYPNATGAMATFHFIGTSVSLYGTLAPKSSAVKVHYTIDETVSHTTNYSSYLSNAYQILLFEQWNLATSNHSLVITMLPDSVFDYYLDYLEYTPIESSITTMCPSTPTVTVSSSPEASVSSGHSSSNNAVILAALLGLVAIDMFILLIVLYIKRRTWAKNFNKYFARRQHGGSSIQFDPSKLTRRAQPIVHGNDSGIMFKR